MTTEVPDLTKQDVARIAKLSDRTLDAWATDWETNPVGPRPIKLSPRHTRYRRSEVAAWLQVDVEAVKPLSA